jgi:hypothetical protein
MKPGNQSVRPGANSHKIPYPMRAYGFWQMRIPYTKTPFCQSGVFSFPKGLIHNFLDSLGTKRKLWRSPANG